MNDVNPYEPPRESSPTTSPDSLPVRASGTLTADDVIATLQSMGKWRPWLALLIAMPVIVVVTIIFAVNNGPRNWWAPFLSMGIATVIVLWMTLGARRRMEKQWKALPENGQPIVWTFSEDSLLVETTNSKHLHSWSAFVRASITPHMFILTQQGDALWTFIPRRFFESDSDWQTVVQLIGAKIQVSQR